MVANSMPCSERFLQQAWLIGRKWRLRIQYASNVPPSTDNARGEGQTRPQFPGLWAKRTSQWPYYGPSEKFDGFAIPGLSIRMVAGFAEVIERKEILVAGA